MSPRLRLDPTQQLLVFTFVSHLVPGWILARLFGANGTWALAALFAFAWSALLRGRLKLVFNDRPTSQSASFTSAIKAIDTNGVAQSINFNGFNITSSTSAFDFSYDAVSRTLAVSDFSNSNVYIFSVVPAPSALALMGLGGLVAGRRRR